eukprot:TRINITY_DN836_c0_g1_i4.p1 TRINITY_DN836_c0_g1~~TRINITY_DN836_c0_g1_i4.p1  ORF type:complete len:320 (-),score=100.40 TRINITY_DN836_c0_g1_i4:92-1051(-)
MLLLPLSAHEGVGSRLSKLHIKRAFLSSPIFGARGEWFGHPRCRVGCRAAKAGTSAPYSALIPLLEAVVSTQSTGGVGAAGWGFAMPGPNLRRRVMELRRFSKEPDLSGGGWVIRGPHHDVICFKVDRDINLWGIGALGGETNQVIDIGVEVYQEYNRNVVVRHATSYRSTRSHLPIPILFKRPALIRKDTLHVVDVSLRGPDPIFAVSDGEAEYRGHGVTFCFSDAHHRSNNSTRVASGQVPSLYFRTTAAVPTAASAAAAAAAASASAAAAVVHEVTVTATVTAAVPLQSPSPPLPPLVHDATGLGGTGADAAGYFT